MSSQFGVPGRGRFWRRTVLIGAALLLQGCAAAPPRPLAGADASDPHARVPAVSYRSTIGDFPSARPSEPAPWRGGNDGGAPAGKKGTP